MTSGSGGAAGRGRATLRSCSSRPSATRVMDRVFCERATVRGLAGCRAGARHQAQGELGVIPEAAAAAIAARIGALDPEPGALADDTRHVGYPIVGVARGSPGRGARPRSARTSTGAPPPRTSWTAASRSSCRRRSTGWRRWSSDWARRARSRRTIVECHGGPDPRPAGGSHDLWRQGRGLARELARQLARLRAGRDRVCGRGAVRRRRHVGCHGPPGRSGPATSGAVARPGARRMCLACRPRRRRGGMLRGASSAAPACGSLVRSSIWRARRSARSARRSATDEVPPPPCPRRRTPS